MKIVAIRIGDRYGPEYEKYLEDTDYAELWVFEDNHAKKLYEELGFKETGEVKFIRDRKYLKMIYENRD